MPAGWPRRLAVATITIGLMMSVFSNSMTNLALPYIAHDLNISAESSIWIVNATQIALVVSLLPVAALADIVGYRHVYRFGLVLFSLASIGCAFAPSLPWLLLGRTFQGLGGAAIMSVQPALVRALGYGSGGDRRLASIDPTAWARLALTPEERRAKAIATGLANDLAGKLR
jgi:DHA2 family multidrug resistance protein-like MFS transporter